VLVLNKLFIFAIAPRLVWLEASPEVIGASKKVNSIAPPAAMLDVAVSLQPVVG
jgi:hypothetical protein